MTNIDIIKNDQQASSMNNEFQTLTNLFKNNEVGSVNEKEQFNYHIALLLSVYFGWCGLDRFYIGKIGTGFLKMITLGGFGLWWIIDSIYFILNDKTDVYGRVLVGGDKKEITVLSLLALGGVLHYFYLGFIRLGFIKVGVIAMSVLSFYLGIEQVGMLFLFVHVIWSTIDIYMILSGHMGSDINGVPINNEGSKYQSMALIFSMVGGFFGLDRFYLGHRTLGLFKIFSFGGLGLWVIIDFVLILLNILKDSNGNEMIQG